MSAASTENRRSNYAVALTVGMWWYFVWSADIGAGFPAACAAFLKYAVALIAIDAVCDMTSDGRRGDDTSMFCQQQ